MHVAKEDEEGKQEEGELFAVFRFEGGSER
jgi:hypothetical protein